MKRVHAAVLLLTLVLLWSIPLIGQRLPIRKYSTDDGLPASQIWSIKQDRRGLIWLGTTGGAVRFDGESFLTIGLADGLPDALVRVIIEAPDGSLWFGTNAGVARYDGKRLRAFTHEDGLGRGPVWAATIDGYGHIWFGTQDGGASVWDGRTFHSITSADGALADYVYSIHADAKGAIWLGHRAQGLTRLVVGPGGEVKEIETFTVEDGLPEAGIRAIAEDRDGMLYFGTRGGGVITWNGEKFEAYGTWHGLSGVDVYAIFFNSRGEIVIGTVDGGVSICNVPGLEDCRWIRESNGLSFDVVYSLFEDREKTLWVGLNNGLNKVISERFVTFSSEAGLASDSVHAIVPEKEGVWLGTVAGLSYLTSTTDKENPFNFESFTRETGLQSEGIWELLRDSRGNLWVGTRSGLLRKRPGDFEMFTTDDGLVGNYISGLFEDSKGNVWVATGDGVSIMTLDDAGRPAFRNFTLEDGLSSSVNYCIAEGPDGRIWIGTAIAGVDIWDGTSFTNYGLDDGLMAKTINHIEIAADGTVWVATTGGGIARYDAHNDRFVSFGAEAGLPSEQIAAIVNARDGRLWLGTSAGIALFDPDLDGGRVVGKISKLDGLAGNEVVMSGGLAFDDEGALWVGTSQGTTRILRPGDSLRSTSPPVVRIDRVEFGKDRVYYSPFSTVAGGATGDVGFLVDELEVSFEENRFQAYFMGLSYADSAGIRYQYRLEGFDPDWSSETSVTFKEYTNLPPGDYVFEVRARSAKGTWSDLSARYSFSVLPAIWQTIWARAGGLLLLGLFIVVGVRLRTLRVDRRNRELQAIVDARTEELKEYSGRLERHAKELQSANIRILEANRTKSRFLATMSHELRTPLNSIIGFSEILHQRLPGKAEERDLYFLQNIVDSGHHLLNLINNLLDLSKIEAGRMEVHSESIHLSEMISGVRGVLLGLATRRSIEITTDIEPEIEIVHVDASKLRQILYNLISNAVKFSPDKSEVRIEARKVPAADSPLGGDCFRISIIDSGVGISKQQQEMIFDEFRQTIEGSVMPGGTGLGLSIVRKLAEIQGGTVQVESSLGEGSTFTVVLPLEVVERIDTHEVLVEEAPAGAHTVLVVEDDLEFREQMRTSLSEAGFEVVCISRGEDAVTVADDVHPSVITLDVILPGIDGWEVLRRLKASNVQKSVPVVMVTASENHELGVALGADDAFVKPFDQKLLVERIRALIPSGSHDASVLLIDDDPNMHVIVREALSGNGYRVVSAENGVTGLELAESLLPALIILDLMMPGMNGFEVAARLQENEATADIPLIILTAQDLDTAERNDLTDKVSSFLPKAVSSPSVLLETVRRLDRRNQG